jgi:hypothetical protein
MLQVSFFGVCLPHARFFSSFDMSSNFFAFVTPETLLVMLAMLAAICETIGRGFDGRAWPG